MAELTREVLDWLAEKLPDLGPTAAPIVVPAWLHEWMDYRLRSIVVWELPGYVRYRGPDGATWIEDRMPHWERAGVHMGGGHRAKRRLGIDVDDDFAVAVGGGVKWETT